MCPVLEAEKLLLPTAEFAYKLEDIGIVLEVSIVI